jgi:hypothetical protein
MRSIKYMLAIILLACPMIRSADVLVGGSNRTSVKGIQDYADQVHCTRFECTVTGTVKYIAAKLYHDASAGSDPMTVLIYSDDAGNTMPDTCFGVSSEFTSGASSWTVDSNTVGSPTVTDGQIIWLCIWIDANSNVPAIDSAGGTTNQFRRKWVGGDSPAVGHDWAGSATSSENEEAQFWMWVEEATTGTLQVISTTGED